MTESEELGRLGELHVRGVLTNEEFAQAKARVLGGQANPNAGAAASIHGFRRSLRDRWIGGVCGGIGQATGSPSWLWRMLFTFLVICAGTGVLLYILLWIFIPSEA
jgi:phage shock protein C